MAYQLTITEKPGYLHAVVTGANTMENVTGYLEHANATPASTRPSTGSAKA
ncbi:MAG: hypothetical protein ACREVI_12705 [Steroidobacteraceae bacterium]